MDHRKKRLPVTEIDPDPAYGLTAEQVNQRMENGWDNAVSSGALRSEGQIILRHCLTFFNLIFVVLALILVLVRSSVTNFGFLGVVVINLVIGIVQEIRAKRAVEKLTLVAAQKLKTVRNGKIGDIPSHKLVLDDIVLFCGGDQICADGVVRDGLLQVNEALLTGEPDLIEKRPGDELLSGSIAVAGKAAVQLLRVGDDSYAARLSAQAKKDPRVARPEMMGDLDKLIRFLSIILVPLGILYFIGAFTTPGAETQTAAEQTVAALVSMIPQGLYLLTSVAMAVSVIKLASRRVLVQDMNCIEMLARTDVLCVDKTGTITEPGMEVEELIPLGGVDFEYLENILGALYGVEEPENDTARALAELYPNTAGWACLRRIPFTSETKWSGAVVRDQGAFVTGAPEFILGSRFAEVADLVTPWSQKGYRVLLCAGYEGDPKPEELDEDRVTPLALILLSGRIRKQALDTFRYFEKQGVTVKVISGDDPVTASEIARRAGIANAQRCVDAQTLETEEAILDAAERYTVFGRVTPDKKRSLIHALRQKKHTVAMTGDGVNDVLAMREADCAVAMASGAKAASQVAQLVLLDSDFAAMPRIVDEGRRVINNIQRAAALFLVKNVFTVALVLVSLLSTLVYPFQPVTLTLINALTMGIPSFFFALEPNYALVSGKFLPGALRRALPGGLTAFLTVVLAQVVADVLALDGVQLRTVCAGVVAVVGILVLLKVSQPMTRLRKIVLLAMAAGLVAAFLALGKVFAVNVYDGRTAGVMLLMMGCAAVLFWGLTCLVEAIGNRRRK